MIRLTLVNDSGEALIVSLAPYFRITGAAVWTVRGEGYIARLTESGWESHGKVWTGMRFEGQCRLIMGLPREPTAVSEILQSVSLSMDVLSANGLPFAVYNAPAQMWRSAIAEKWWHAFRIESGEDYKSSSESDEQSAERGAENPGKSSPGTSRGDRLQ